MPNPTPNLTLEQRERVCREVLKWRECGGVHVSGKHWIANVGDRCKQTPHITTGNEFFQIVDAMREQGWGWSIQNWSGVNEVDFWRLEDMDCREEATHPNPTTAAALAALKAKDAG